jgi:hypothetical protein
VIFQPGGNDGRKNSPNRSAEILTRLRAQRSRDHGAE